MRRVGSKVRVFLGPPNLTGGLAQLGERLICIQEVSGSIPLSSTMRNLVILFVNIFNYYQYLYPIVRIDEQSRMFEKMNIPTKFDSNTEFFSVHKSSV